GRPQKLARVLDPSPELRRELSGFDAYRHGSEEKFVELDRKADELLMRYTARVANHLAAIPGHRLAARQGNFGWNRGTFQGIMHHVQRTFTRGPSAAGSPANRGAIGYRSDCSANSESTAPARRASQGGGLWARGAVLMVWRQHWP